MTYEPEYTDNAQETDGSAIPDSQAPEAADDTHKTVHKIKSYLTSILLRVEMIDKIDGQNLSEKSHENLSYIRQATLHIKELIKPK